MFKGLDCVRNIGTDKERLTFQVFGVKSQMLLGILSDLNVKNIVTNKGIQVGIEGK